MNLIKNFKEQIDPNAKEQSCLPWEDNLDNIENPKNKNNKIANIKKLSKIGLCILALLLIIIAIFNFVFKQNSISIDTETSTDTNIQKSQIQVHVAGEVKNPGVYTLDYGSRIMDAVNAAGGFNAKANQSSLNLAKVLEDGEQIMIESTESSTNTTTNQTPSKDSTNNGKININTADISQLQTLSGVGPATAQKIIDYRNANGKFKTIEDLKKVSGIGDKTFAKFADKICV